MSDLILEEDNQPTVEKQDSAQKQPHTAEPQPTSQASTFTPVMYVGSLGEMVKLVLANVVLTIPTLGIYSFWGKTRLRKYVASSISVANDTLEYLGTGMELFLGFLKASPILIALAAAYIYFGGQNSPLVIIPALVFIYLINVAVFAAIRYRFSRTSWRGIRGYVEGSAFSYANVAMWRTFLNVITVGILIPSSDIKLHKHIMDRSYFGSIIATFDESAGKGLMGVHIITLLLAIPTLGLSRLWYHAALKRAQMAGLKIDDIGFQSTVTGGAIFMLLIKNMLTVVGLLIIPGILATVLIGGSIFASLSGGNIDETSVMAVATSPALIGSFFIVGVGYFLALQIAKAINANRNIGFACSHFYLKGDLETSNVLQAENQKTPVGEGLDDALGLDTGLI